MTRISKVPVLTALVGIAVLLTGCGGTGAPQAAATTGGAPAATQGSGRQGQSRFPGAAGLVAEVDGRTLQVQGNNTQTAVTWSPSTAFTSEIAARPGDVVVGVCVMVRAGDQQQGTATTPPAAVTAQSVAIAKPVAGQCDRGFARGGGGSFRSGRPGATGGPSSGPAPSRPAGAARGFGGFGGAFGRVTAVSKGEFTVASTIPSAPPGTSSQTAAASPRIVHVTTTPATTYTMTVQATAAAARVGTCVTARGASDATGAIAATSIAVRPAQNGSCATGFGPTGQGTETSHG